MPPAAAPQTRPIDPLADMVAELAAKYGVHPDRASFLVALADSNVARDYAARLRTPQPKA